MRRKKWNYGKQIVAMLVAVLFFMMTPFTSYAAGAKVLSTLVYDGDIYIYVRGNSEPNSDSAVQIGNMACSPDQISIASFANLEPFMRTVILVDNSKSIPTKNHSDIQEILQGIIAGTAENEQVKIGTFAEQVSYLCDYTNDHNVLESAISAISYNNQDTYLSDVLYDVISELKAENTYVYTRILILADGADNKSIGYTNDEVRSYIENNAFPVYSIGIPGKNNTSELETMFSFSRAAKAEYFLLDGSVSNGEIANALQQDKGGFCLRVSLDESLKDGSNKRILLKLNTSEGLEELTANADMPFGAGMKEEPETEKEEPETETTKEETLPVLSASSKESEAEDKTDNKDGLLWIGIVVGVGLLLILVVTLVFIRKKRNSSKAKKEDDNIKVAPVKAAEDTDTEMTEYSVENRFEQAPDNAKELWGTPKRKYLIMRNLDNPFISFKVPIIDKIRIGRLHTQDIVLDDSRVSREHCEIILRGDLLYIKDCDSKNKTYYENAVVYDETPIISGGKIKIGRYNYTVELIKE